MAGLAAALTYYRQTMPALLMRPSVTVREAVGRDDVGVLGPPELVGFALPPFVVNAFGAFVGTVAAAVLHRTLAVSMIVSLLISLGVAVVICLIIGIIYHPVLGWFVRLLRGESTPASRSHLFGMAEAAVLLGGVLALPANVIAVLPFPFVGAVSVVLGVYTGVLALWVAYAWYRHFQVVRWFQVLLLILAVLSVASGAWNLVQVGRAGVATLRVGAGGVAGAAPDAAQGAAPMQPPAARPPLPLVAQPPAAAAPLPPTGSPPPAAPAPPEVPTTTPAASPYEEFVHRRNAIEAAIDRDPTLLNRKGVLPLYKEMQRQVFRIQDKHRVKLGKRPSPEKLAEKKIADRLSDAEIYEQTRDVVDKLYDKIVGER
ncbi:MAG: hypothetical protein HYZ27_02780 [Deltaproteobacteria bacterium]|nr:hypothetical protein [Deltaproteobacteria bacterium]